ncbi:serpin family protein, partial [Vibrio sp. FNV 38]|nr:serpin family protein [Vibrio sp. FNV 38]
MWFILPDKNISAQELLYDEQVMDFILKGEEWEKQKSLEVNETIPKFDVVSDIDLSQGLKNMGITDVFDSTISDFSPTTTDVDEISVTKASHSARVVIDEEGCVATAFAVIFATSGAKLAEEEID